MPYEIKRTDYVKPIELDVDGEKWQLVPAGSGTELRMGQIQRRIQLLDKKLEAGTATDDDLDKYDAFEQESYDYFLKIFKDGTDDNAKVKAWVEATPMVSIYAMIENIKSLEEAKREAESGTSEAAEKVPTA